MNARRVWIFSALAVAAAWSLQSHDPDRHSAGATGQPAGAGMVVHIDPVTGAFVEPREGGVPVTLDREVLNGLSTSAEGLVEVPSPVPGGGVMVDLRGRFQNTSVAVLDEGGALNTSCRSGLPHTHAAGEKCEAAGDVDDSGAEVQP